MGIARPGGSPRRSGDPRTVVSRALGVGGVFALAVAACTLTPKEPGTPESSGVGGHVYNPPTPNLPEQIDNDAGDLIGTRRSDDASDDAPPRPEGDAAFPESDSSPPILIADSGRPVLDSGIVGAVDATPGPDAGPDGSPEIPDASALPDTSPPEAAVDSAPPPPAPDAGPAPTNLCDNPLGAGDLAIVELMLVSQQGPGDMGQWLEVQSTRSCSLDLKGLLAAASGPSSPYTMQVTGDVYLPANGIFVIANSLSPALDNDLPGPLLFGWNGSPADVLSTAGGTVTLSVGTTVIDNFVYPQFQELYIGVSISFPADCPWGDRSNWARWSFSTNNWYGDFLGTPNAPNTDVTCY